MNENGGTAFPVIANDIKSHMGMSLRDYFAAKAMQTFLVNQDFTDDQWMMGNANDSYRMADAMLAVRNKRVSK